MIFNPPTVEIVISEQWSWKVAWFFKEHYCAARNHITFHDHALLVTFSTVPPQKQVFIPLKISRSNKQASHHKIMKITAIKVYQVKCECFWQFFSSFYLLTTFREWDDKTFVVYFPLFSFILAFLEVRTLSTYYFL